MRPFRFPLKGVTCCTEQNLKNILNQSPPTTFVCKPINLTTDRQTLVVEVEEVGFFDSEEQVRLQVHRYLKQVLVDSPFKLIEEPGEDIRFAENHFYKGMIGIAAGSLVLGLNLSCGLWWWSLKLLTAIISIGLSLVLGFDSFQNAKIEWWHRKPAMDSLFLLSTGAATSLSTLGLFVPDIPMMFETSLFIFGFRHIGMYLKKSLYTTPEDLPVRYRHLARKSSVNSEGEQNKPSSGAVIDIQNGEMIPVDGWLLGNQDEELEAVYPMNVQRIKGAYLPEYLSSGDAVMAGMVAEAACKIQIGLGHQLQYFSKKPKKNCPQGQLWIYPESEKICVSAQSDLNNQNVKFFLTPIDLSQKNVSYHQAAYNALKLGTISKLPINIRQLLSRAMVNYAQKMGLNQTGSALVRLEEALEDSKPAPIQETTNRILEYFVPALIGTALLSGAVTACCLSPIIALRCMISILVSACPCTLGLVTPLVMDFAFKKGIKSGVAFTQLETIQRLTEVNTVLLDLHGTATQGRPVAEISVQDEARREEINLRLACLEQQSNHHVAKAIYTAVNGDALLVNIQALQPTQIQQYPGGISASMDNKQYILGNWTLVSQYIKLEKSDPNQTYLLEQNESGYQLVASVKLYDPLRKDTAEAVQQLKKRGLKVCLFTGADEMTAKQYAHALPGLDEVYANLGDAHAKKEKLLCIQNDMQRVLMIGDGANDGPAMQAAHASIAMQHESSDEGAHYQAKARILNGQMMAVLDALDIANQAMWRIKFNLLLSLIYNLAIVLVTNYLVLATGMVIHPGVCAALMVVQIGFILLSSYYFKHQTLPTRTLLSQSSMFAANLNTQHNAADLSNLTSSFASGSR